jgi:hypothetical protein
LDVGSKLAPRVAPLWRLLSVLSFYAAVGGCMSLWFLVFTSTGRRRLQSYRFTGFASISPNPIARCEHTIVSDLLCAAMLTYFPEITLLCIDDTLLRSVYFATIRER